MKNSKTVLIDKNPGRNSQTFGVARNLNTDLDLIHEPSIGVVGNKGDSQCYFGVEEKVFNELKNKYNADCKKSAIHPNLHAFCSSLEVAFLREIDSIEIGKFS